MEKVEEKEEGGGGGREEGGGIWQNKQKIRFRYCQENMLTSNVNCLEETGHHVKARGMWPMFFKKIVALGMLNKDDIKAE